MCDFRLWHEVPSFFDTNLSFKIEVLVEMVEIYIDPVVLALRELHSDVLAMGYMDSSILDRLTMQANSILNGHRQGNPAVVFHLGSWCPDFAGADSKQIMASSLNVGQAQLTIAREHGFNNWSEVEAMKNVTLNEEFEQSVDAVLHGDVFQLQQYIEANPALISQKSQYGHGASLMHYIGANGVESYRQITPLNAADVVQYLISAGADVNVSAEMYGGGTTALSLVLSSAHPKRAGVTIAIAELLKRAGAV